MGLDASVQNAREFGRGRAVLAMSGMHRTSVTAIALAVTLGVAMLARAETTPVVPTADTTTPAPAPVVRQSTPIPNDPEPAVPKRPKAPKAAAIEDVGSNAISPEELDKPLSHRCFVRDVMAFYDRTHVRCYNPARGKFSFFAVDTSQPVAETLLNKSWKAMRSGKPLTIKYAPTADLNPTSCAPDNCRRLIDVLN